MDRNLLQFASHQQTRGPGPEENRDMKFSPRTLATALAAASFALCALGAEAPTAPRGRVGRLALRSAAETKAVSATASYSVEVPYVQSFTPSNGGQGDTLVLNQAHSFNISLLATDQHHNNNQGNGTALPQTDTFGYFSLPSITSNPSNPEVFVEILDATGIGSGYWVFYAHLTDLIYDLTVTDNVPHASHTYHKDAGNQPGGFDTTTFPALTTGPTAVPTGTAKATGAPKATRATKVLTPNAFLRTSIDISNNTS